MFLFFTFFGSASHSLLFHAIRSYQDFSLFFSFLVLSLFYLSRRHLQFRLLCCFFPICQRTEKRLQKFRLFGLMQFSCCRWVYPSIAFQPTFVHQNFHFKSSEHTCIRILRSMINRFVHFHFVRIERNKVFQLANIIFCCCIKIPNAPERNVDNVHIFFVTFFTFIQMASKITK